MAIRKRCYLEIVVEQENAGPLLLVLLLLLLLVPTTKPRLLENASSTAEDPLFRFCSFLSFSPADCPANSPYTTTTA